MSKAMVPMILSMKGTKGVRLFKVEFLGHVISLKFAKVLFLSHKLSNFSL